MGLDQYAYAALRAGQYHDFYESGTWNRDLQDTINHTVAKPKEIAYWRKHPNLQGWMEKLAEKKGFQYASFNGVELELTWEDLEQLEKDINQDKLAELKTTGFFFGNPSDDYYREYDLKFIREAKAELFLGLKVFYNSSW